MHKTARKSRQHTLGELADGVVVEKLAHGRARVEAEHRGRALGPAAGGRGPRLACAGNRRETHTARHWKRQRAAKGGNAAPFRSLLTAGLQGGEAAGARGRRMRVEGRGREGGRRGKARGEEERARERERETPRQHALQAQQRVCLHQVGALLQLRRRVAVHQRLEVLRGGEGGGAGEAIGKEKASVSCLQWMKKKRRQRRRD